MKRNTIKYFIPAVVLSLSITACFTPTAVEEFLIDSIDSECLSVVDSNITYYTSDFFELSWKGFELPEIQYRVDFFPAKSEDDTVSEIGDQKSIYEVVGTAKSISVPIRELAEYAPKYSYYYVHVSWYSEAEKCWSGGGSGFTFSVNWANSYYPTTQSDPFNSRLDYTRDVDSFTWSFRSEPVYSKIQISDTKNFENVIFEKVQTMPQNYSVFTCVDPEIFSPYPLFWRIAAIDELSQTDLNYIFVDSFSSYYRGELIDFEMRGGELKALYSIYNGDQSEKKVLTYDYTTKVSSTMSSGSISTQLARKYSGEPFWFRSDKSIFYSTDDKTFDPLSTSLDGNDIIDIETAPGLIMVAYKLTGDNSSIVIFDSATRTEQKVINFPGLCDLSYSDDHSALFISAQPTPGVVALHRAKISTTTYELTTELVTESAARSSLSWKISQVTPEYLVIGKEELFSPVTLKFIEWTPVRHPLFLMDEGLMITAKIHWEEGRPSNRHWSLEVSAYEQDAATTEWILKKKYFKQHTGYGSSLKGIVKSGNEYLLLVRLSQGFNLFPVPVSELTAVSQ